MKLYITTITFIHCWLTHCLTLGAETSMPKLLTPKHIVSGQRHKPLAERRTNHDLIDDSQYIKHATVRQQDILTKKQRKTLRDLLMAGDPAFLSENQRPIMSAESHFDDKRRFRRTNSRQRSGDTSERDRRREIRRASRERTNSSPQSSLSSESQYILDNYLPDHPHHHHSSSLKKQYTRIFKQLNATNSSNPDHAVIYKSQGLLPRYGKWSGDNI